MNNNDQEMNEDIKRFMKLESDIREQSDANKVIVLIVGVSIFVVGFLAIMLGT